MCPAHQCTNSTSISYMKTLRLQRNRKVSQACSKHRWRPRQSQRPLSSATGNASLKNGISFHGHLECYFSTISLGRLKAFGSLWLFLGPQKITELYTTQIHESKYLNKSRDWKIKMGEQLIQKYDKLLKMYTVMDWIFARKGSKFYMKNKRGKQDSQ